MAIGVVTGSTNPAAGQVDSAVRKSYVAPALEIIGFDLALNLFDRAFLGAEFRSNGASIRRNVRGPWVIEDDPYLINQFGHPYQGGMYHGFARSTGHGYWVSALYTFAGSALWEIAGETTAPSKNDQVASGIGGAFLGESLFRIANLVLERGGSNPGRWRGFIAAVVSPPLAVNRQVGGRRFDRVVQSRNAPYYRRWQLGVATATVNRPGESGFVRPNEGIVDLAVDYGLPGRKGYSYRHPFDYFTLQVTASSAGGFENFVTRGLLAGRPYEVGGSYRGLWGLYGSYDYVAPQVFRVSSTALSLGTTMQWWLAPSIAFQGTALGGAGFAAVGTIRGADERDYHYGLAPQAALTARFLFGDLALIDLTAREYYVSDAGQTRTAGADNILRGEASLTWRLYRQNALALRYLWSRRDASDPELGRRTQIRGTLGVFYTLLGHDRFGAVDWR
jgi:hypothetical protein